jgi:hypothetical protein
MAMKPKDRYQTVADFTNDLRTVMKALPASTVPPVVNGRPVDPHGTQPDLPMLYEAMQNAQAAANQATPAQPIAPTPPQTPGPVVGRCSRCGMELTRLTPYCPRCGNPLSNPPHSPKNQAQTDSPQAGKNVPQALANHDVSQAATMLIRPRTSSQEPQEQPHRPGSPSAPAKQQVESFPTLPAASAARQQMLQTPAQSVPSVQSEGASPKTLARTDQTGTRHNVKPFIPSAPLNAANAQTQTPASPASLAATSSEQTQGASKKLFIIVAMVIVALIIVMLLLLVFLRGHHYLVFHHQAHIALLKTRSMLEQL